MARGGAVKEPDPSYRELLALPSVGRLLASLGIARISQSMVAVTFVLFTLSSYQSATLAGVVTFFSIVPGLLVSPIAGALLDRHGRTRLIVLDYFVALAAMMLIGILAMAGALPVTVLIVIAAISSLTAPLSNSGLRSLFPLIIPRHLWGRVNAIDSAGYVLATIVGPPLAAGLVAIWGGAVTFVVIGIGFGFAAMFMIGAPDPPTRTVPGRLLADAWRGVVYTWRNRSLRGLGLSVSVLNLIAGTFNIVVPLLVLHRFELSEAIVGLVFAVMGVTGVIAAVFFGKVDTTGRERMWLATSMSATGLVAVPLLIDSNVVMLFIVMGLIGFVNGPLDVTLFTLRQRRTDPEWTGRAFAVSMAFNVSGVPIGSAIAGVLAARSVESAIVFGVVSALISGVMAWRLIPAAE